MADIFEVKAAIKAKLEKLKDNLEDKQWKRGVMEDEMEDLDDEIQDIEDQIEVLENDEDVAIKDIVDEGQEKHQIELVKGRYGNFARNLNIADYWQR